jgi:hypothetical protein
MIAAGGCFSKVHVSERRVSLCKGLKEKERRLKKPLSFDRRARKAAWQPFPAR